MGYRYETHLHTCQGSKCGRSTGAEQARFYKEAGYQGIDYTVYADGTLFVDSYHGAYSEWCSCGEHAYIIKVTEKAG